VLLAMVVFDFVFTVVSAPFVPRWLSAKVPLIVPAGRCAPIPSNISNANPI
jgi:hypothetical protein